MNNLLTLETISLVNGLAIQHSSEWEDYLEMNAQIHGMTKEEYAAYYLGTQWQMQCMESLKSLSEKKVTRKQLDKALNNLAKVTQEMKDTVLLWRDAKDKGNSKDEKKYLEVLKTKTAEKKEAEKIVQKHINGLDADVGLEIANEAKGWGGKDVVKWKPEHSGGYKYLQVMMGKEGYQADHFYHKEKGAYVGDYILEIPVENKGEEKKIIKLLQKHDKGGKVLDEAVESVNEDRNTKYTKELTKIFRKEFEDFPFDYYQDGKRIIIRPEGYNPDGTLFDMKDDWREDIMRVVQKHKKKWHIAPNMGGGLTIHIKESHVMTLESFSDFTNEGKMPDKYIGNDEIVYLKTKEDSKGANYNLYYKGYDIDKGGRRFGSEKELKDFAADYILSNQWYKKLRYEDPKPLPESVNESKKYKRGDELKIKLKNGKEFDLKFDSYSRQKGMAFGKFKDEDGEYTTKPFSLDTIVESVNEAKAPFKYNLGYNDKKDYWKYAQEIGAAVKDIEGVRDYHKEAARGGKTAVQDVSNRIIITTYGQPDIKDAIVKALKGVDDNLDLKTIKSNYNASDSSRSKHEQDNDMWKWEIEKHEDFHSYERKYGGKPKKDKEFTRDHQMEFIDMLAPYSTTQHELADIEITSLKDFLQYAADHVSAANLKKIEKKIRKEYPMLENNMKNLLTLESFTKVSEARANAKKLLKSVVKGETSSVEGIKLSKEMAQGFLDWLEYSNYGKKFSDLPFDQLFKASFNWGLDRFIKGANTELKKEFKELKAKSKE